MPDKPINDNNKNQNSNTLISVDIKYHTLVDGLSLGVVYLSKDLKVIDNNHIVDYWFPTELKNSIHCFQCLDLASRSEPCEDCRILDVFETGYSNESIRIKKTSIGYRTFKIIARPVKDADNEVIAIMETLEDITELLESRKIKEDNERELVEFNQRFLQLAEQSKSVTWEVDKNGLYTYVSDNIELEWGYKKEDLVGKVHVFDLHPSEVRAKFKEKAFHIIKNGISITGMENPVLTKSGKVKWVLSAGVPKFDKKGNIIGFKGIDTDVTSQKESEHQLVRNRRFLSDMLEYSGTLIYQKDLEGKYTFVNKKWEELTRNKREFALGKNDFEIFPEKITKDYTENDKKVVALRSVVESEEYFTYDDNEKYVLSVKFPIFDENDEITGICGMTTDITERKLAEEQILYLATHDFLTSLPTSAVIKDRIKFAIEMSRRNTTKFAVFFIDLNGFKEVNDQYGHDVGDKVLVEVANRIADLLRKSDTASRIAGDEFIILAMDINDMSDVKTIIEKLRNRIKEPINLSNFSVEVDLSIGVAIYPNDGQTTDDLIKYADRMMYLEKNNGKFR